MSKPRLQYQWAAGGNKNVLFLTKSSIKGPKNKDGLTIRRDFWDHLVSSWSFPCGSTGKESACNVGDRGSIPGLGRSPEEGKGYRLQKPHLENFMDRPPQIHPAYLTYMQSTSWETLGWRKHKLESRLPEKYQLPQIGRWHHPYGRKWRGTKEPLDESERGEWKSWLKAQHSEN